MNFDSCCPKPLHSPPPPGPPFDPSLAERARWGTRHGGVARTINDSLVWETVPDGTIAQQGDPVPDEFVEDGMTPLNNAAILDLGQRGQD